MHPKIVRTQDQGRKQAQDDDDAHSSSRSILLLPSDGYWGEGELGVAFWAKENQT